MSRNYIEMLTVITLVKIIAFFIGVYFWIFPEKEELFRQKYEEEFEEKY